MNAKYANEISANLQRAEESLNAAKELLAKTFYDSAVSRAYYTAFYAASALLLHEDFSFSKHSAVLSAIHQHFVKTGRLDVKFGKDLNWLFEMRNISDYGVTLHVPSVDAEQAVVAAENFFHAIHAILFKTDSPEQHDELNVT